MDEADAKASLRVVIEKWEPGSRELRGGLNLVTPGLGGLGEGEIVVRVEALSENGELAIQGSALSWVDHTTDASVRAIAELIANAVVSGSAWPRPPSAGSHSGYP